MLDDATSIENCHCSSCYFVCAGFVWFRSLDSRWRRWTRSSW